MTYPKWETSFHPEVKKIRIFRKDGNVHISTLIIREACDFVRCLVRDR